MSESSEKSYEFPMNQKLLEEASKLKEERMIIKERLTKIEQNRPKVSDKVYNRVKQDYAEKLQKISDELLEKKQTIEQELTTLYETKGKIQKNLETHQETLEELEFRQALGEFSQEDFYAQTKTQKDKIQKFQTLLSGIASNIQRYEKIFAGEESLLNKTAQQPVSAAAIGAEEESEEELFEMEPKMAPPDWTDTTQPQLKSEDETTIKATLTMIAGHENVGTTYSVGEGITIGRSNANEVVLRDAKSSRQHVEIRKKGTGYIVTDLHSSNGTFLNGEKIQEAVLNPGDEIRVGDHVFKFKI